MLGCENHAGALPDNLIQLGNGLVTPAQSSVKMVGTGGQICYLELKNGTIHATPVTVRFFILGPEGEKDLCSSSVILPNVVGDAIFLKYAVFGERITWRSEVKLAVDVDVAQVACRMLASAVT